MSVMENNDTFRRFAGVSAIFAGLLAIASAVFGAAALGSVGILAISYANAVYQGLWNPLEMILGGAWWLGSGFLIRRRRPTLGIITLLVGTAAWLDAFSIIFNLEPLFLVALSIVLPDLSSIPFHLLPVAVGLMFAGFVIFFIGIATGLIAGVRAPRITRALRRR